MLKSGAGEERASKTEAFLMGAVLDPASPAGYGHALAFTIAAGTMVLLPQIRQAEPTVHTAWSYQ